MATEQNSIVEGRLRNVPVTMGHVIAQKDFIVLPNFPFHVVIGHLTLKQLEGTINFKCEVVYLD